MKIIKIFILLISIVFYTGCCSTMEENKAIVSEVYKGSDYYKYKIVVVTNFINTTHIYTNFPYHPGDTIEFSKH